MVGFLGRIRTVRHGGCLQTERNVLVIWKGVGSVYVCFDRRL